MSIKQTVIRALAHDDAETMRQCAISNPGEFMVWAEALLSAQYQSHTATTLLAIFRTQLPETSIQELLTAAWAWEHDPEADLDEDPAWLTKGQQ